MRRLVRTYVRCASLRFNCDGRYNPSRGCDPAEFMRSRKNRRKKKWRVLNLALQRESARLARLGKRYNPNRLLTQHKPILNPVFRIHGRRRGTLSIVLSEDMTLSSKESSKRVLLFLEELRRAALNGPHRRLVLDFGPVKKLAPEVAVLLLAEIQRCHAYCERKTRITGTYPSEHNVKELLIEMGFFEALGVMEPALPSSRQSRTYVRVERHNRLQPRLVDDLIDCFEEQVSFTDDDRKRLRVGLVECIDNVDQHAYLPASSTPHLYKEWWLVGFADHHDGRVAFIFYDQGSGIPTTIKQKRAQRVLNKLRNWTDSDWLKRAVTKPISRLDSRRRGHGLVKLKRFIDNLESTGELRVMSNRGDFIAGSDASNFASNMELPLNGTLVIWSLEGIPNQPINRRCDSDVVAENEGD